MNDSMQEIEAKFYVLNLGKMEARLLDLGAECIVPRQFEHNLRFDNPRHSLSKNGEVLRLRRFDDIRLTYKGRGERKEGSLVRSEIEIIVNDYDAARQFIEALGYQSYITYEKYRAIYRLDGHIVTLDELPYGHFVEIEAESPAAVRATATRLELNPQAAIPASYQGLFERIKKKRGLAIQNISFAEFSGLKISPEDMDVTPATD